MHSQKIVGLNISHLSYSDSLNEIIRLAKNRTSSYCCFANVHMTIEAYDDKAFEKQVNEANLVCADGMPLVKATQLVHKKKIERVAGMDMMPSVMEKAENEKLKVFFFGTTDEVLREIESKSKELYPDLQVVGKFSPPFRKLSEDEKKEHIDRINTSGANIVFVALGCPKQEKWMAENYRMIKAVLLGVGGAFPVFAGIQSRAPKWVRDFSLEWLYRLSQDPKRLFKRYFYTNTKFLFLLAKQYLSKKSF